MHPAAGHACLFRSVRKPITCRDNADFCHKHRAECQMPVLLCLGVLRCPRPLLSTINVALCACAELASPPGGSSAHLQRHPTFMLAPAAPPLSGRGGQQGDRQIPTADLPVCLHDPQVSGLHGLPSFCSRCSLKDVTVLAT